MQRAARIISRNGARSFRRYSTKPDPNMSKMSKDIGDIAKFFNKKSEGMKFINFAKKHPFKAYLRVGGLFFGGVFIANATTGMLMNDPPLSPYDYPQTFAWMNLMKSCQFALIWPSVPFMLLDKDSRSELMILGQGVKNGVKQIEDDLQITEGDKSVIKTNWKWTWSTSEKTGEDDDSS